MGGDSTAENKFQSTPPARGATSSFFIALFRPPDFNPRPPRGGRRHTDKASMQANKISIHAPREGGDQRVQPGSDRSKISIHAPREGGDPAFRSTVHHGPPYFNPRPPRGGRPRHAGAPDGLPAISIHAPREGGDAGGKDGCLRSCDFNPRPPRGGRPSLWGLPCFMPANFNPRPPRGGRLLYLVLRPVHAAISIHAPREGGDHSWPP